MSNEVIDLTNAAQLPAVSSDMDVQITTAKRYPRDTAKCMREIVALLESNPDIAASCIYAKPVQGKTINGPSVRLAELIVSQFGNMRAQVMEFKDDGDSIEVSCAVVDLEKNVGVVWPVRRRAIDKNGMRYAQHVLDNTVNAAYAIAYRNAVLKVVPKVYTEILYQKAREIAQGNAGQLVERRGKALEAFKKIGVPVVTLCKWLEVKDETLIGLNDIGDLIGLYNALKDGETTIEEAFKYTRSGAVLAPEEALTDKQPQAMKEAEKGK